MNPFPASRSPGVALVETILSTAVLAVAAPLALAAMIRAGDGASLARMDTRAPAIIDACLAELELARHGSPQFLPALDPAADFGVETPLCLLFDRTGAPLGDPGPEACEHGVLSRSGETPVYLVTLAGRREAGHERGAPALTVTLGIEYPAASGRTKRRRTEFITRLP